MLTNQLLFPPFFWLRILSHFHFDYKFKPVKSDTSAAVSKAPLRLSPLQSIWPPLSVQKLAICCGSHGVPTTTTPVHLAIWSPILPIFTEKSSFLLSRIKLSLFWVPCSSISSHTLTYSFSILSLVRADYGRFVKHIVVASTASYEGEWLTHDPYKGQLCFVLCVLHLITDQQRSRSLEGQPVYTLTRELRHGLT